MNNIIIWGIGKIYNQMRNNISYFEKKNQIKVKYILVSNPYMKKLDGYIVKSPEDISNLDYDYIIIMSDDYYEEILNEALIRRVERDKIISYKVLQIPNINLNRYFYLKEKNISIISNNCWGGVIYSTLGLECLSPFKNLYLTDEDYLKVISNLEYYLKQEPVFDRLEKDPHSCKQYPILKLKDIEIHCNHSDSYKDAIRDWNRRKIKLNYNNIFYEMYTEKKESAEKFYDLTLNSNSICFVPWETKKEKTLTLQMAPNQNEFYETVNSNATIGSNALKYELVELLLGNVYTRY